MSDQETLKSVLSAGTMQLALAIAVVVSLYQLYFTIWRPVFPGKGVALLTEGGPILGASRWWSARLDFLREWTAKGQSVMNFYVGRYQVINVSGEANRIAFLEDKNLGLGEGYTSASLCQHDCSIWRLMNVQVLPFDRRINRALAGWSTIRPLLRRLF